jgi:hypothetical protein
MAKKRRKPRPRRSAPTQPSAAAGSESEPSAAEPAAPSRPARAPRKQIEDERPPAPWGSFPLVELVVLVGLVMLLAGFFFVGGTRGTLLLATGLALGSLAGLELSVREHFGGYRSHTLLLAGAVGVAVLALLYYGLPDLLSPGARVGVAVLAAVLAGLGLARAFRKRAGRLFKLR